MDAKVRIVKINKNQNRFSYTFLLFYQLIILCALPLFVFIHIRQSAPIHRFWERLGLRLRSSKKYTPENPTTWFHAASLGEVKQIQILAQRLHQEQNFNVVVTTFTLAGADWVQKNIPFAIHKFAPIDSHFFIARFMRKFNPQSLVIVEGDIWPVLLNSAYKKHIPITLLNARSSQSRKRNKRFYSKATSYFNLITCPTESIRSEFQALGINNNRIKLIDSLKASQQSVDADLATKIKTLSNNREVLVIASTHISDEAMLFDVLNNLQASFNSHFIIWAPRHLRRATAISQKLTSLDIPNIKRSDLPIATHKCDALILDTLGELSTAFAVSNAVYLGGGFGAEGGHNPFEPAYFGVPIATGPNVENHKQAFDVLMPSGSIYFVNQTQDILNFFTAKHQINIDTIALAQCRSNKGVDDTLTLLRNL